MPMCNTSSTSEMFVCLNISTLRELLSRYIIIYYVFFSEKYILFQKLVNKM